MGNRAYKQWLVRSVAGRRVAITFLGVRLLMKVPSFEPRAAAVASLVLAVILLAVGPADAAVVLTNLSQTAGNAYGFTPPVQVGLGFNTGSSAGQIDALSLSLVKGSSPSASTSITFSVLLYPAGVNGLPSGAPISQDNGVAAAWTNPVAGQLQTQLFTYSGSSLPNLFAAPLAANTKYVVAVANDSGTPSFEHYWSIAGSGGYTSSGGYSFTTMSRTTDGTSWSDVPFYPIASLSVTAVPEPASFAMAFGGLACGWSIWRRHRRPS